jgi:type VI protein secretion system component Hcp
MTLRWRMITVTAVAALGGATAVAVAAVPDGNGEIHACLDVITTTGGVTVPKPGPNLTVIDPDAGQQCIPPDGSVPNQTEISWSETGPQGPPGIQGATGPSGPAGPAGSTGVAGSGVINSVTIAPPRLNAHAKPVADVTLGSGSGALTFSILAAEQAGVGAGQTVAAKRTKFHDFSFTKKLDKASPNLFKLATSGKHIPSVTIEYAKRSAAGKYLEITLSEVVISSDQTQASAEGSPAETIHLNYGAIKWTYTQQKPTEGSA